MQTLIKIFLAVLLLCGQAWADTVVVVGQPASAPAASCTIGSGINWVNADHSDYWGADTTEDHNFQEVANSAAKNICKIVIYITNTGITHNAVVKIKSMDKATTYGTSDTTEILADITDTQVTFNFTTVAEVPANDFVVSLVDTNTSINIRIAYTTNRDQYFGGTSYKGTYSNTEHDEDFAMEIWYEQ